MSRRKYFGLGKRNFMTLVSAVLALVLYVAQQQGWLSAAFTAAEVNQPGSYKVTRYVDGDTVTVDMDGK
jgi:endonuclease YncB( thermonuclease family)